MVKLLNAYFPTRTLVLAVSEAVLITLGMVAAIYARFGADGQLVLLYESGLLKVAVVAAVCILCMHYYDLYDSLLLTSPREVLVRLFQVLGTTCLLLAVLYYAYPDIQLTQGVFLSGILLVGFLLIVWRKLFFVVSRAPQFAEHILLVGQGPLAVSLVETTRKKPEVGVRMVGYVANSSEPGSSLDGLPRLGSIEEIFQIVERERVGRVLITMGDRRGNLPVAELLRLKTRGVRVEDGSDFYEMVTGKVPLESLRPSWLLFSPSFRVSKSFLFWKRISSAVLAALALLLSLPLMGILALVIRLTSGTPILFRQQRVGKDGRVFTVYKFRSMHNGGDHHEAFKPTELNDDRYTALGRWLRRFRLDELPQLYNILRGDMHFVGPRPFALEEEEELAKKIPFYTQRWLIRPGATGWAQIQRGYCATLQDNAEKLAYDLFYIKNMSVGLDLLILFQTFKILLLGRGAR